MKEIEIPYNSGTLSATLFDNTSNKTILIIASATGVKQKYYYEFAKYAESKDVTVITFDYNGIGSSLKKPIEKLKINAADWGSNDIESIIQYAIKNYPKSKKVILGHSIGGQLIGLAESCNKLDKIILVAAQSGYWKHWKGFRRMKMWFNWYILFPLILRVFGYLKSKRISGMENLPKNVAEQWRNWGKNRDYIFSDKSIKNTFYETIEVDMTAYSIDDDNFAPKEAVQWMTEKYKNANRKSIHLNPIDFQANKIGHFGIFKERFKNTFWTQILTEIK